MIGVVAGIGMLATNEVAQAVYLLLNERKQTLAGGKEWRFL